MIEALDAPKLHPAPPPSTHTHRPDNPSQAAPAENANIADYKQIASPPYSTPDSLGGYTLPQVSHLEKNPERKTGPGRRDPVSVGTVLWTGLQSSDLARGLTSSSTLPLSHCCSQNREMPQWGGPRGKRKPEVTLPFFPFSLTGGGVGDFWTIEGNEFKTLRNSSSSLNTGIGSTHFSPQKLSLLD